MAQRENKGISSFSRVTHNITKMGYYPTKKKDAECIGSYLSGYGFIMLDPCCGTGEAFSVILENIQGNGRGLGVEIEEGRAKEARARQVGIIIDEDFLSVNIEAGSFGAVFLNPPYETTERLHQTFIEQATQVLAEGGVLILMIPGYELSGKTAVYLDSYYEDFQVFRSTDDTFKQIILFGVKREHMVRSDGACFGKLLKDAEVIEPYSSYQVPWLRSTARRFSGRVAREYKRYDILRTTEIEKVEITFKGLDAATLKPILDDYRVDWNRLVGMIPEASVVKQPIMPLRRGHLAQILASGLMDGLVHDPKTKAPYLIKGTVNKVTEVVEDDEEEGKKKEVTRDVVTILMMNKKGVIENIQ